MKIRFVFVGKTVARYLQEGVGEYSKRLSRYCQLRVDIVEVPSTWGRLPQGEAVIREGELLLKALRGDRNVWLLDERGESLGSAELAARIGQAGVYGESSLTFVVGGPYGFSEAVYSVYAKRLSLSRMTFSHQMVRLILLEQVYRAFTILNGEPYHHA